MRHPGRPILKRLLAACAALAGIVVATTREVWVKPFSEEYLKALGWLAEPVERTAAVLSGVHHFASAQVLWLLPLAFLTGGVLAFAFSRRIAVILRHYGLRWRPRPAPSLETLVRTQIIAAALADPDEGVMVHQRQAPIQLSVPTPSFEGIPEPTVSAMMLSAIDDMASEGIFENRFGRGEIYRLTSQGRRSAVRLDVIRRGAPTPRLQSHRRRSPPPAP